jgi:hypothetical protein
MKYHVNFQSIPRGNRRPADDGPASAAHSFEGDAGVALLPNVGDYVSMNRHGRKDFVAVNGRVKSRYFIYFDDLTCAINIVVEEVPDEDFAALIKE